MRARLGGEVRDVPVVRDRDADLWHGVRSRRDAWLTTLCRRSLDADSDTAPETPEGEAECLVCVRAIDADESAAGWLSDTRARLSRASAASRQGVRL